MFAAMALPSKYLMLDEGKWFAPGEALPPGYVITAHPEGHTTPQETDNVTEKARDWISAVKQRRGIM